MIKSPQISKGTNSSYNEKKTNGSHKNKFPKSLFQSKGVSNNSDSTFDIDNLKDHARKGDAKAQFKLAVCYATEQGVTLDLDTAKEYYKLATKHSHGQIYNSFANNVEEIASNNFNSPMQNKNDYANAQRNVSLAQYNLAMCYFKGWGVEKNLHMATQKLKEAAINELPVAQYDWAECYANGFLGFEINLKEAFVWYSKSSKNGFSEAQYQLAECYAKGLGVEKNEKKSLEFVQKSANNGNARALNVLGMCYCKGWGVEIDIEKAFKLFKLSSEKGLEIAKKNFETLQLEVDSILKLLTIEG